MNKTLIPLAAALLLGAPFGTFADEVWNSTYGPVVYAEDNGATAIWTYTYQGQPGVIYILGLAGIYSERGSYDGYWAQNQGPQRCNVPRPGLNAQPTYFWGRFQVRFETPAASAWNGQWGYCDAEPSQTWNGSDQPLPPSPPKKSLRKY